MTKQLDPHVEAVTDRAHDLAQELSATITSYGERHGLPTHIVDHIGRVALALVEARR